LPPTCWVLPVWLLMLYFAVWRIRNQLAAAATTLVLVAIGAHGLDKNGEVSWSPYYKVVYTPSTRMIDTNDIGHQQIVEIGKEGTAYLLQYLLNRDAGGRTLEEVMIIGAGGGTDVSAALRAGVKRVDAVEIERRLYALGR